MNGRATDAAPDAATSPAGGDGGPPDISVVIVVYKTPDYLRRALDSLESARLALSWEAIVVDNAPDHGDCRSVAAGRPRVTYVPNARNVGFGRACNQGMRLARGRRFLLLNPDMEVHPGQVEKLHAYLESEPDVGIAAPRLHYADGRLQETCRTFYTLKIFLLRRTFLGRIFRDSKAIRAHLMLDWDHETTRDVDWCIGACLLVRREAVEDVGMMDERFFMYFEDVDWCYRMHQRGWRVVYHPEARMTHHYQRASARRWPTRGLWIHLGSTLRYYEKWSFVLYWLKLRARALRNVALFLGDAVMVLAAFVAAYALRAVLGGVFTKPLFGLEQYARFLGFSLVVAMISFVTFGLYRERLRPSVLENAFPVAKALGWTTVLMMAATFLFSVRVFSRVMVVLFFPVSVLLVTLGRTALIRLVASVRRRDLNLRRLALLGPEEAVEEVMGRFREHGSFGFDPFPMPAAGAAERTASDWARRLRVERVQEVLLFEDWPGDVAGLLLELRERSIPVRLVPSLRAVLPLRASIGEFMGWPAVNVGGETGRMRSPARRFGDLLAAAAIGLLWGGPFLVTAAARALAGRGILEELPVYGYGGRPVTVRRVQGARRGAGPLRTLLDWYPALGHLAAGRLSLVGICPLSEDEYARCDAAYRRRPPEAPPGLLGPWVGNGWTLDRLQEWNRQYPQWWSPEGDLRIFWRTMFGWKRQSGGMP